MLALRVLVSTVVAVPLMLVVGWPQPLWATFLIGVVACGAGHAVVALVRGKKEASPTVAAEPTEADRRWEEQQRLRKALARKSDGD
jgi:hypothetical protein